MENYLLITCSTENEFNFYLYLYKYIIPFIKNILIKCQKKKIELDYNYSVINIAISNLINYNLDYFKHLFKYSNECSIDSVINRLLSKNNIINKSFIQIRNNNINSIDDLNNINNRYNDINWCSFYNEVEMKVHLTKIIDLLNKCS